MCWQRGNVQQQTAVNSCSIMWTLGKRNGENALNVVVKEYDGQVLIHLRHMLLCNRIGLIQTNHMTSWHFGTNLIPRRKRRKREQWHESNVIWGRMCQTGAGCAQTRAYNAKVGQEMQKWGRKSEIPSITLYKVLPNYEVKSTMCETGQGLSYNSDHMTPDRHHPCHRFYQ